jgi:predicted Zn-dependent protease
VSESFLELAARAVRAAEGDEAEAFVSSEHSGFARFAGSEIHQPTLVDDVNVRLRIVRDGREGIAVGNRSDDESLRELARRAAGAANAAPADPDFPGLAPPEPMPPVEGYDEETAALAAADLARLAGAAMAAAGGDVFGFVTTGVTTHAIVSTTRVAAEQMLTDATAFVIAADRETSGHAEQTAWAIDGVDPEAIGRAAEEKRARTAGARELDAGDYAAVLEPWALAELLEYFAWDSFGGLGLLEERSYLAGRLGERVFDPKLTIVEDPLDPRGLPKAFDFEGCAKRRAPIVEDGVARGVVWDRRTAARAGDGQTTTGNAPPPSYAAFGPTTWALSVRGGDAESVGELLARIDDGIYVTRLHYLSVVEPRQGIITGMTRDGTFRVRGGKLAEPLVNLRFTVNVPAMLAELPGLTRETTLVNRDQFYDERYPTGYLVPALATARFSVTGTGSRPGL